MKTGLVKSVFLILFSICVSKSSGEGGGGGGGGGKEKVEYVRLPLLTFVENPESSERSTTTLERFETTTLPTFSSSSNSVQFLDGVGDEGGDVGNWTDLGELRSVNQVISQLTHLVTGDDDGEGQEDDINVQSLEELEGSTGNENGDDDDGGDDNDDITFNELDLIDLVQELERQADEEEQTGIFPEILDILHGKMHRGNSTTLPPIETTTISPDLVGDGEEGVTENYSESFTNSTSNMNPSPRIFVNEDGDLQLGSGDLSDFSEEIVDGISAGVEESLRMLDDLDMDGMNMASGLNGTAETRQFSVYLFQGQYYAEPRLNRFIDGALRNMGTELRVASMDPLYFRVLPRGRVAEREQPLATASGIRRRRPVGGRGGLGRQMMKLPAFFRPNAKNQKLVQQKLRQQSLQGPGKRKKVVAGQQQVTRVNNLGGGTGIFLRRKRQRQKIARQRRRRQRLKQQRLKQQQANRRKKQQQQNQKNNQNKKQNALLNRIRRRIKQDVGGGRIEGLSRVQRDGDAEMQLFGNYTLIRSHMKLGPVEITMQFRTKNGIRRSGATLPAIRAHTVTRVNHEGSEMIDYLLDRPTPEMIRVRGTLFPLAQRIARNIFARLFLPNSFLVSKLREKASLAYLSKPVAKRRKR